MNVEPQQHKREGESLVRVLMDDAGRLRVQLDALTHSPQGMPFHLMSILLYAQHYSPYHPPARIQRS